MDLQNKFKYEATEEEIERVWSNTRTFKTAESEVVVLYDLFNGLKESGYAYSKSQATSEQLGVPFLIIDKTFVKETLEEICGEHNLVLGTGCQVPNYEENRVFNMRISDSSYEGGKLGLHPSSVLTSQDLLKNHELMILLLGELSNCAYYSRNLKFDSPNVMFTYHNMSAEEATERAKMWAVALLSLCSPLFEERSRVSDVYITYFSHERNLGGKINLTFNSPTLFVNGIALYEIGIFNRSERMLKELEDKFASLKGNLKAQQQLMAGIEHYRRIINSGKSEYSPLFKILT
jgi:hypothetical protein